MARRTKSLAALLIGVFALLFGMTAVASATPYVGATETFASTDTPSDGGTFTVSGTGFGADETVSNTLHSASYALTSAETNAAGDFSVSVTLPAGVTGVHHIVSTGETSGDTATLTITIGTTTTTTTSSSGSLPFTGADVVAMVVVAAALIGGGGVFFIAGRRRRSTI